MYFFFFQAEDGIRDLIVTGVQTCALPISVRCADLHDAVRRDQARADRRLHLRQADYARHGDRRAGPLTARAMLVRRVASALRQAARAGRGHHGAAVELRDPRRPELRLPRSRARTPAAVAA